MANALGTVAGDSAATKQTADSKTIQDMDAKYYRPHSVAGLRRHPEETCRRVCGPDTVIDVHGVMPAATRTDWLLSR